MRRLTGALILLAGVALARWGALTPPPESPRTGAEENTVLEASEPPAVAARDRVNRRRQENPNLPESYFENPLLYLSTASVDSLILLPGIGPVIAERLASARSGKRLFTRWEDLLTIKGIGPKKLHRLRTLASKKN